MFKKETLMEEIMQYFSTLQGYVYIANRQGLNNATKLSEDFFGGLLNIIENLNLINVNNLKMNFPAIDLGDREKRICYQVTSTNEFKKVKETIDKFNNKKLYTQYDVIKIVILGQKRRYRQKCLKYKAFEFIVETNVIDLGDLTTIIGALSVEKIEEVLNYLKNNFDKSILGKISELAIDKSLLKTEQINEAYPFSYYCYGLGRVRVDAYLPLKISDSISCLFTFGQDDILGCRITLDEEMLQKNFFCDYKRNLDERKFIAYKEKEQVGIDFPNNRLITDIETANQIAYVIDKLYEKYKEKKKKILNLIGANNFSEVNYGQYKILKIPIELWIMMHNFSMKHNYWGGESEWDIFNPQYIDNRIMIYKNHKETSFNGDIIVDLISKRIDDDYVEILWSPGYTHSLNDVEGFNNKQKWKVDHTHDWLINEFIPYVLCLNYNEKRKFYNKAITFEKYKKQFIFQDFGIESLSNH
ncbi:SMEK domain-containing protein [Clostridium botulinum]|uniref:SMEK domain-containing protein n=1 Tax=Clostridium botulinum TaxID=1491 RepID=UPI001C9B5ED5|nr:SMEK domain-containing protein [Clostridium botulinum]MBY6756711.1 SMEK domain-containing protein [Clostridium botulinum]